MADWTSLTSVVVDVEANGHQPPDLVAHNAHVDVGVLQRKLDDWKTPEVFDTLKLARRPLVAARLFVRLATTATTLEALRGDPPGGGGSEASTLF